MIEKPFDIDTIVRLTKTGQFARIVKSQYAYDGTTLMHYLSEIEGREGQYAIYHYDVELECLPIMNNQNRCLIISRRESE